MLCRREKAIYPTWRVCNPQSSHAPPRRDRGDQDKCLDIPLACVCKGGLSCEQWRLVLDNVLAEVKQILKLDS